ncbi:sigma-70 family RNA polymerase sigma factor [Luteolibacter flavescens]|uniref:Sigma-70 family RNA polymerase sigma factor n=1 Tax=Luteolibacter flavescens TaxID=1859460 RepID=A0ABT3FP95_9BACT|nr:sigma-70 family RNA polymerase sigma factor [Luteolibacter flavescens]MCW1885395.1 sigma-70 family RNA polymerase sigma factor [Luteolibacter flavescens]
MISFVAWWQRPMPMASDDIPPPARFATTRWTVLGNAGEASHRDQAWDHFCRAYWFPVYAYIRRRGEGPDESSDLTQAFFAKLIEQDWLSRVERRDTRFSTLLITVLKNFLIKRHHRDHAQKRGGGEQPVPLDLADAERWFGLEPSMQETPESLFEKRWAHAVMEAALARLRAECEAAGRAKAFEALGPFLSREPGAGDYETAGARLGIQPRSVAVAVHRLRADFRAMVREEVAAGLRDEEMVDEEMRALAAALGG